MLFASNWSVVLHRFDTQHAVPENGMYGGTKAKPSVTHLADGFAVSDGLDLCLSRAPSSGRERNADRAHAAGAWRMNGARTASLAARCPSHWRASSMMERTSRPKWNVKLKATGRDIFVFVNGLKIAKRGYPDTPQAGTWVSLEPGWKVISSPDRSDLIVSHNRVRVH
jgi:hypothetical protein